uniref:DUF4795 domain-containing protein n=1 Tax=Heliothis virescens TaxID=7102 RepID=A0A2A4J9Z1_HELVI
MQTAMQYRKFLDEPNMSDKTLLISVEDLINTAFGTVEQNVINFKLVQTVLHILARQMRLLEQEVEIKMDDLAQKPGAYDEGDEYDDDQEFISGSAEDREQMAAGGTGETTGERSERAGERSERAGERSERAEVKEPVREVKEPVREVKEPVREVKEPVTEMKEAVVVEREGKQKKSVLRREVGKRKEQPKISVQVGKKRVVLKRGKVQKGRIEMPIPQRKEARKKKEVARGRRKVVVQARISGEVGMMLAMAAKMMHAAAPAAAGAMLRDPMLEAVSKMPRVAKMTAEAVGAWIPVDKGQEVATNGGQKTVGEGAEERKELPPIKAEKGLPSPADLPRLQPVKAAAERDLVQASLFQVSLNFKHSFGFHEHLSYFYVCPESTRKGGKGGPKDKILVVEKGPTTRGGQVARVGSIEVVTASEFALLVKAVRELANVAGPLPMPALPDNERLRQDLAQGRASLSETMQAMQLTARIQAAEDGLSRMAELLTQLAAAGALPKEMAGQIGQVRDQLQQAVTAVADAVGQPGAPGMIPGGPGMGPGGKGPGYASAGVGPGAGPGAYGPQYASGGTGPGGVGPGMGPGGGGQGKGPGGVAQGYGGPGMGPGGVGPGMGPGGVGPGMGPGGVGPGMGPGGMGPGGVGPGMGPAGMGQGYGGPGMGPGGVGPGMGPGGVGPGMGPGGMGQGYGGPGMGPGGVGPGMGPGGVVPGMGPGGGGPGMGPGGVGPGMGPGGVGPGMGPGGVGPGMGPGGVGPWMGPGDVGPGMGPGGVGQGYGGPGMEPGGTGPGGVGPGYGGPGTGIPGTPGGVGPEAYVSGSGRKSVAIDPMSSHPESVRRGDGSGGTSRASVGGAGGGFARRPSEMSGAVGPGGAVTHPEMENVLQIMRSELIKDITMMTTRATHSADIASNTSKAVADKLDVALGIDDRISKLFSLANDYAEQLSGFDSGLTTQMASFQEQMAQMRIDLKGGIQQLEQANNNAETAAILELTERYEGLVIELDNTLHTHQSLTVLQKQLSDELRSLVECVEMLREQKADRDEVLDGLRDKADITRLAGLLHEGDFAHAREDLEKRLEHCYEKFRKQDEIWLSALKDLSAITEGKAEIIQLLAIKDNATEELQKIQETLRQLYIMLGEPKAAMLMRLLAKGAACGSCLAPALMEPQDRTYGQPPPLPALRPPPDGEEPCTITLQPLPPPDNRHHVCRRWVGGSHTLVGGPVTRERAVADTRTPATKRFTGYGTDGRMYMLEEELQPCVECNKLGPDEQDGDCPLPTPTDGGGDQAAGTTPVEDDGKDKK